MQLVPHGPDVPDALLRAHEEGRVVFFCGAGVSCAAGLPTFKEMVREIYRGFHTAMEPDERTAFSHKRYAEALGMLEKRLQDKHLELRDILPRLLRPRTVNAETLRTHEALLRLGRTHEGTLKLVTTNFDDLFETAARRAGLPCPVYSAPTLPLPLPRCWDGLVYLHGKLHENPTPFETSNLILADGDFGRAYLMEGWAARFTSMLLHNCEVCFIGYGIEDQVVRYMLNALDADKRQELPTQRVWAFRDNESPCDDWAGRGVTPIVYSVENEHLALHRTLHEWARLYRGGTAAKIEIVERNAPRSPSQSSPEDDFASRLLWAVSGDSELPLRRFTSLVPAPPLDWLERLRGVLPMGPAEGAGGRRDRVDDLLSNWFLHYAADENLIVWLAKEGGRVSPSFREKLEAALPGKKCGALPPGIRALWRLLLSGRMACPRGGARRLALCLERMKREGVTASQCMELHGLLLPYVRHVESAKGRPAPGPGGRWEVALPVDDAEAVFKEASLPAPVPAELAAVLDALLREARGLGEELYPLDAAGARRCPACTCLEALSRFARAARSPAPPGARTPREDAPGCSSALVGRHDETPPGKARDE